MWSIIESQLLINFSKVICTLAETLPALGLRLAPLHFRNSAHTRQKHILKMLCSRDILCPKVCLHSDDMFLLFLCHLIDERLIRIHLFYRKVSSLAKRFVLSIKCLIEINITICVRCHDSVVAKLCGLNTALSASP